MQHFPSTKFFNTLFIVFATTVSLTSCEVINPAEEVPAYLSFRNARVLLDENSSFSSRVGIKDIWFYHSGFLQGIFPVNSDEDPNGILTIPYINVPDTSFYIKGGVIETGQSSFRLPYPFWDDFFFFVDQDPGDTAIVEPLIRYKDPSEYTLATAEDFEGISFGLTPFNRALTNEDSTNFVRSSDAFMGNWSGKVNFGPGKRYFEVINTSPFFLNRTKDTYAEITYKCNLEFNIGLVYLGVNGLFIEPVLTVSPRGDWNTVYVHLIQQIRDIINDNGEFTQFWLWLYADGNENDGYLCLDNVRLIHEN